MYEQPLPEKIEHQLRQEQHQGLFPSPVPSTWQARKCTYLRHNNLELINHSQLQRLHREQTSTNTN